MFKKSDVVGFSVAGIFMVVINAALSVATIVGGVYGIIWVLKHFAII